MFKKSRTNDALAPVNFYNLIMNKIITNNICHYIFIIRIIAIIVLNVELMILYNIHFITDTNIVVG